MKIVAGNLLHMAEAGEFDAIVHGCNCFKGMGAGIAGQIAKQYPQARMADDKTEYASPSKLTYYSVAEITKKRVSNPLNPEEVQLVDVKPFTIINAYTQYKPGPDFIPSLFPELLKRLNTDFKGQHLGFPLIGCGIGGGDWEQVMIAMLDHLTDVQVTVVVYG